MKRPRHSSAFTLPEIIIGVALLGLMLLLTIGIVNAAKRLMPGASCCIGEETLPISPDASAYAAAVRFHCAFKERLDSARAVYVLGGEHQGLPSGASRSHAGPLAIAALPVVNQFSAGLPMDAFAFYQAYTTALGAMETPGSLRDFSVITVGTVDGSLAITSLIQVRSRNVAVSDGAEARMFVREDATLYDISGDTLNYTFLEKDLGGTPVAMGARHFWYRYDEGKVAEEGPVLTVFPDPWVFRGADSNVRGQSLPVFSQFIYLLAVSP